MKSRAWLWSVVAVLLVATGLRVPALGKVPPGLYHDEAIHGLDALDILRGRPQVYFAANNGREPLFIYLVALAVAVLGRSPFALRLPAVFAGILTVSATAAMGRVLFSRRVGSLGAAALSVMLWHVHLSRSGFRAILLPLFTALVVWQGAIGIRTGRRANWAVAGFLYGLSAYTYTAARLTPIAFGAFLVCAWVVWPPVRRLRSAPVRRLWKGVGLAILAAVGAAAPLIGYAVLHPNVVLGRPGQVSVFSPAISAGDPWGLLGRQVLRALGMFFVQGDRIWRHNVPWRPVFEPLLGAAFVAGLVVAAKRSSRSLSAAFALIWTAGMLLPTVLAEDAPHFLRAVGVLPIIALFPALGLDWVAGTAQRLFDRVAATSPRGLRTAFGRVLVSALLAGPLLFGLGSTTLAYFGRYARDPYASFWFESGAVTLAGRVNSFLGRGWDGLRMLHGEPAANQAYLDAQLWGDWPQVRFLVARESVTVGVANGSPLRPTAAFAWPYAEWDWALATLPAPRELTIEVGPDSLGDRETVPYTTYVAFYGTSPDPALPARARLTSGIEYLGATVEPVGNDVRVRLRWRATASISEDYTVFVHYLRDGERVAQGDSAAASGYYPTHRWQPGDVINDDHLIENVGEPVPGRDVLRFGLWRPESGAVLRVLDDAGNPASDWLEVPVGG